MTAEMCGYSLKQVTAPAVFAASAADVRAWAQRTDPTNLASTLAAYEDGLIEERIQSATAMVESFTDRVLCSQTWRLWLDRFPPWEIELPKGPWQSITWVKYYDVNGVQQTISSSDYIFDDASGILTPAVGDSWPSPQYRTGAVEVKFVSGFGATPGDVPAIFKDCLCKIVLDWLENRRGQFELPSGVKEQLKTMWSGHW